VKAGTVAEIGQTLEERVQACKTDLARREGARAGLIEAGKKLHAYMGVTLEQTFEIEGIGLEEQRLMRKVAQQMFGIVDNLATKQEIEMHRAAGAVAESEKVAGVIHKLWKGLDAKVVALEQVESGEDVPGPRPGGARPGPSIAAQRKAEESATPTEEDIDNAVGVVQQDDVQSSAPEPEPEPEEKPKPKRRSRARKATKPAAK
jgi:hypothetical protein